MRPGAASIFPAVLLIAACGSRSQPAAPEDPTLQRNARAGELAFSLERPEEAARQYEQALERARERDDATAIGDYGYDLAVAQLAANKPREALAAARMTRTELARRNAPSFPALDLAEATALYRVGETGQSDWLAMRVEAGYDPTASARASYLRGLIADETGNAAGLDEALARLAHPASGEQQADAEELLARRALRQGEFNIAAADAGHAADLRRSTLDYREMARALSVAADAELHAGNRHEAAELYLRAGQSAAAQGDPDMARAWLRQAMALGGDSVLLVTARRALRQITPGK